MKIPISILAPLVVVFFFGTIFIAKTWELPSAQREFSKAEGKTETLEVIVQGLRCRGTANFFMKRLQPVPGIVSVTTYVQEHRAAIKFDPSQIDEEAIIAEIEKPVSMKNGRVVRPFTVTETLK